MVDLLETVIKLVLLVNPVNVTWENSAGLAFSNVERRFHLLLPSVFVTL